MNRKIAFFLLLIVFSFTSCNSQQKAGSASKLVDSIYTHGNASPDGIGKFYKGREISRVMGAAGSDWLERAERQNEEAPDLAIANIRIPANGRIADIGAGTGYYSFRLASRVPHGKVFAVELQDEMIQQLRTRKTVSKDSVVEIVKSNQYSVNLPDSSVDLALMVDVYHELEFPQEILQSLRKSLRDDGQLLLIEYRGEDPSVPIKALHKTTVKQLRKELLANGFELVYKGDFLPIQHFLLFQKKS